ncbi:MAG: DUF5329 domain-containing protein, partial [Desulfobacteraceae bacterium]|nr:DUF5329 domain-containing protein [Desulfobacteraceae bacterium]
DGTRTNSRCIHRATAGTVSRSVGAFRQYGRLGKPSEGRREPLRVLMKKNTLWLLVLLSLMGGYAYAQEFSEAAKIQYLIGSLEALQGVTFLRNGAEYDAKKAADHLRLKLKMAGDRVKNAEDFIRLCASKSSMSGEVYRMRFPDGTTMEAETFFRERLKALPVDTSSRP